jgi:hypothetical protein
LPSDRARSDRNVYRKGRRIGGLFISGFGVVSGALLILVVLGFPSAPVAADDVEFRFLREVRGRTKRHRRPLIIRGASGASKGLALPIGDWRPGDYRVVVDLHDRVSDARATAEGTFRGVED